MLMLNDPEDTHPRREEPETSHPEPNIYCVIEWSDELIVREQRYDDLDEAISRFDFIAQSNEYLTDDTNTIDFVDNFDDFDDIPYGSERRVVHIHIPDYYREICTHSSDLPACGVRLILYNSSF